jgi:acyl dehydratase
MREGMRYEDFKIGDRFQTAGRTVTQSDIVSFTTLTGLMESIFIDDVFAKEKSPYKKRIAPGALTYSFAEGLTVLAGLFHNTGIAFLGVEINIPRPVCVDDTISVEIEVLDMRETKKPDRGLITFVHRVINQNKETVMEYKVKRMILRKEK